MSRPKKKPPTVSVKRPADTVTIGWMLSVMTTLGCEIVAALSSLMGRGQPESRWILLSGLTLFAAIITGTASLLFAGLVLKLRPSPPPRPILVAAVAIGLAPWLAAFWLSA